MCSVITEGTPEDETDSFFQRDLNSRLDLAGNNSKNSKGSADRSNPTTALSVVQINFDSIGTSEPYQTADKAHTLPAVTDSIEPQTHRNREKARSSLLF